MREHGGKSKKLIMEHGAARRILRRCVAAPFAASWPRRGITNSQINFNRLSALTRDWPVSTKGTLVQMKSFTLVLPTLLDPPCPFVESSSSERKPPRSPIRPAHAGAARRFSPKRASVGQGKSCVRPGPMGPQVPAPINFWRAGSL